MYITEAKDMYVEVNVKSKQIDDGSNKPARIPTMPSEVTVPPPRTNGRPRNKDEPETEEDKMLMNDFIRREEQYKQQIANLKKEKEEVNN